MIATDVPHIVPFDKIVVDDLQSELNHLLPSIYKGIPKIRFIGKVIANGKAKYKLALASGIATLAVAGAAI